MKNIKGCLSSGSDDYRTPTNIYNYYINILHCIDLFPFKSSFNQFDIVYDNKLLFCNPPFSQLSKVVDYLIDLVLNHNCEVYLLMPCRTDTRYFNKLYYCLLPSIYFFSKRLHFNDSRESAPFPSMLLHLKKDSGSSNYDILDPESF